MTTTEPGFNAIALRNNATICERVGSVLMMDPSIILALLDEVERFRMESDDIFAELKVITAERDAANARLAAVEALARELIAAQGDGQFGHAAEARRIGPELVALTEGGGE